MLVSQCFIPNSSNKISPYIIDIKNPFSKVANIIDGIYPRLSLDKELLLTILYEKIIHCKNHKYIALSINIDKGKNIWRMLEVIHLILSDHFDYIPKQWQSLITLLKSTKFNNGIKNRNDGLLQIYSLTYSALNLFNDFVTNNIDDDKEFVYDKNFNIDFLVLFSKYQEVLDIFITKYLTSCTCNNYIIFSDNIKNKVKEEYVKKPLNIINDILNSTSINYNVLYYQLIYIRSTIDLLRKPPLKTINTNNKIINISYDILPQLTRIDYLKKLIHCRTSGDIYYDRNYNETTNHNIKIIEGTMRPFIYKITNKINKCFVCDNNLLSEYNYAGVIDNNITESNTLNILNIVYSIICRCINCKNGKYGNLLLNNDHVIMARNYKWITFYLSLIDIIPKDILWTIIMLYQNIR